MMNNKINSGTELTTDKTKIFDRWVQYRVVAKANMVVYTTFELQYQFAMNEDLAIAAQYHSAW